MFEMKDLGIDPDEISAAEKCCNDALEMFGLLEKKDEFFKNALDLFYDTGSVQNYTTDLINSMFVMLSCYISTLFPGRKPSFSWDTEGYKRVFSIDLTDPAGK